MPEARADGENTLSDLERRLRGWQPAAAGLSRERMLFEAGRAAGGQRSRPRAVGVAIHLGLLAACAGLLAAWSNERLAHQRLGEQLLALQTQLQAQSDPEALPSRSVPPAAQLSRLERPDPMSYLVLVRRLGGTEPFESRSPIDRSTAPISRDEPLPPTLRAGDRTSINL